MKNTQLIIDTLHSLGFHVNFEKTVTTPTQIIDFFGLIIDSKKFKVFLPRDKIDKIKNAAESLLQEDCICIREVAAFIGLIVHAFNAISIGPLYYRALERDKVRALNENDDNYEEIEVPAYFVEMLGGKQNLKNIEAINVIGDSMEPTLNSNNIIFIDKSIKNENRDGIYAFTTNYGLFVKRVQKRVDGKLDIISDNKDYPLQVMQKDEINILGKVISSFGMVF